MSNEFNYEFNYILFCFLAHSIQFSLSYSKFMDEKQEDSAFSLPPSVKLYIFYKS